MEKKPLTGLFRDNPETPEGKYLVKRRDGTVMQKPNFVLVATDPLAIAALRAYAEEDNMDTRDGHIHLGEIADLIDSGAVQPQDQQYLKDMEYTPTPIQRATMRVGRNDQCPCGSGKKFKKCCLFRKR